MGTEVLTVSTSARRLWELVHRPVAIALAELDGGGSPATSAPTPSGPIGFRRALQRACTHGEGDQVVWETP